jgi:hypothetical protein
MDHLRYLRELAKWLTNLIYHQVPSFTLFFMFLNLKKKKKRLGPAVPVNNSLPLVGTNGQVKLEPVAILDRRIVKKNNQVGVEIPVQWSNLDLEDATLEDYDQLKIQFPLSKLEDKLKGKGNVMSAHGLERLGTVVSLNSKIVPKGDGAREAGQELGMGCVEQTV